MFVQSAQFIAAHRQEYEAQGADTSVFVSGQEKESETVKLARMNLAVNGVDWIKPDNVGDYVDRIRREAHPVVVDSD